MKCKSWSNKINNFVVRRLKSIKINGEQQIQHQQYLSTCTNTMPAMPKEKSSAVSLNETNFSELKLKEQLVTSTATAMANTSASTAITNTDHVQLQQQQHLQQYSKCDCVSALVSTDEVDNCTLANKNQLLTNGHSSPLAAAMTINETTEILPESTSCCRTRQKLCNSSSGEPAATMQATGTQKSYVIPPKKTPNDFIFGKYIGEGSFSNVYLAVDINTKREYAIKVCEKSHILREHKQEYIKREREVMHTLTNVPGFVNLSCTFQDNRSLYFVMTYAKNGDLLPYINKVGSFDGECTRHYAAELVLACEQMHCRKVVHRDLKPENILLDENMHTLIADFGSAKILAPEMCITTLDAGATSSLKRLNRSISQTHYVEAEEDTCDAVSDETNLPSCARQQYHRKRKGSFVGTAQYVSPEVLQNGPITPSADLWALGCIVYQMISGLPPFRGSNDYHIFKQILACELEFPEGFDKNAEDIVRKLLRVDPTQRLGADNVIGRYESIRSHPFFAGINFDTIRLQTPPPIYPYLPGVFKDDEFRSVYSIPDNLEPGLDDKQLSRLLCDTFLRQQNEIDPQTANKNIFDLSAMERKQRLEQQKPDKWNVFADSEVILKKGYINKRKGLFARKRMLLLTTGPRLIYIDPVQMIKKGEIPWSAELRVEAKNFKIFFVHTPNRTYYLEDPEGYSLEWVDAIENMRKLIYKDKSLSEEAKTEIKTTPFT